MSLELEIFKEFPHKIEIPVAWVEMDIYNHVNNANYFKYFEEGKIKYFEKIGLNDRYKVDGLAGVLSSASCNYIAPLVYPDIIVVGTRVVEIQKDLIQMEQYITTPRVGLSAFGEFDVIIYDFKNTQKIEIPDSIKIEIEKLENKTF